ncbi:MAG: hypothetical protein NZ772_14870 [Cyanobacteria bacterium]|nr:hypothetical protein [Cyanobacteriota bacterium]MDW8202663.1 hypothetical protein [Cyanobacteriota bacterium SKYGB_h_bin112]
MATTSKKTSKSVAFTTDEADKALLREIETLLAQGEYASFSDLCKDALEQFFFPETAPAATDAGMDVPLVQVHSQLEQVSAATSEILAQLRQQASVLEQAGDSDLSKLESQITKLSQQLKQVDTRTAQTLTQIQRQITDLEQQAGTTAAPELDIDWDGQFAAITERIERVEARVAKVLKELQQRSSESATTEVDTEAIEAAITRHVRPLLDRIGALEKKTDDRFQQIQQALTAAEEAAADREEQYLTQLEEQFARLAEQLMPSEPEPLPESAPEQLSIPEPQVPLPRQTASSSDDPLLSRLSVLIEDF